MNFCTRLNENLNDFHLLKHSFYQAWSKGELSLDILQLYAKEYYPHVSAFPRYISSIHSLCLDISSRQILLENLIEEEQGPENHPELWLRFSEGLGVSRKYCKMKANLLSTHRLVDGYFDLVCSDYPTGLGALYAYERQTPEISKSKIEGLKTHYGIDNDHTLQFFKVHMKADEWHTEELSGLMNTLSVKDQKRAAKGAQIGAKLLWSFLDGIMETNNAH